MHTLRRICLQLLEKYGVNFQLKHFYCQFYIKSKFGNYSKISYQEIVSLDIVLDQLLHMCLIFFACHCFCGLEADSINLSIVLISPSGIVSIQSGSVMVSIQNFFSLTLSRSFREKCLGHLNISSYIVYEESCWILQCFRIGGFFLPFLDIVVIRHLTQSLLQSLQTYKSCDACLLWISSSDPRARVFLVIFECERES